MTYRAPIADIAFTLNHAAGFDQALAEGIYGDLDEETIDSVLAEAGRFASEVIAPLNAPGDKFGTPFKDGQVVTPPGWKEAYKAWSAAGWNGLAAPAHWGGQELPNALNAACIEMWNSASMAFGIGPVLTMAAVDALHAYGSESLKQRYLEKLAEESELLVALPLWAFVLLAPSLRALASLALRLAPKRPPWLVRTTLVADEWAMLDVFALAMLIVYSKLAQLATTTPLAGFWILVATAAATNLDAWLRSLAVDFEPDGEA